MRKIWYCREFLKVFFLIITGLQMRLLSIAQQAKEPLKLTLEKARAIALEKNPDLKAARIDESINALALAEARLKRLPQLYGDFNMQRNIIIPVTPVPANAFDPNAPEGKLLPLRFTTKWTSNAGINGSIELFNPQKKLDVKEATIREKITRLENTHVANDIYYEVGTAYIAALIAAEQLRLAIADTLTKAALLAVNQQRFDEGRLLLTTLNQAKAGRNNTLNLFEEALRIFIDTRAGLLYTMGFSPEEQVEILFTDSLEALFTSYQANPAIDTLNSIALNKQIQENELADAQIKAVMNGYLPSLTLKGYYGSNYFDNNFDILKSSNWNGNSFVNLGLRLPITGGLQRQKSISQLRLQQQASQLRYVSKRNKNSVDHAAATREAAVFKRNYLRTRENLVLAESNFRIAEQQFAAGRLTIGELNQADYDYQQEKNNYLNIAYQYISAKLNIEKLSGY